MARVMNEWRGSGIVVAKMSNDKGGKKLNEGIVRIRMGERHRCGNGGKLIPTLWK